MHISHQQIAVANNRLAAGGCATVNGAALANGIVIANLNGGILTGELEVLWHRGNYCSRKDTAVLADTGTGKDSYIGAYPSIIADFDIVAYSSEVGNGYILSNLGVGVKVV